MSSSLQTLPTRGELRCAGISFILAQILWTIAWILHSIDHDVYDVKNEQELVELHNVLSSSTYRMQMEIACTCFWLAFPLLLIAIYALQKTFSFEMQSTPGQMLVYLFEKAYLLYIGIASIIYPALTLVAVSYDWSFHETTASPDVVPSGYWIQLYLIIFEMELWDCLAVADAVFMISIFLLVRYMLWMQKHDKKYKKLQQISECKICRKMSSCSEIVSCVIALSLFIIFLFVLFQFAESGFLSPFGHIQFLIILVFLIKIGFGARMIFIANSQKYDEIKKLFAENDDDQQDLKALSDTTDNYQMTKINVEINDDDQDV